MDTHFKKPSKAKQKHRNIIKGLLRAANSWFLRCNALPCVHMQCIHFDLVFLHFALSYRSSLSFLSFSLLLAIISLGDHELCILLLGCCSGWCCYEAMRKRCIEENWRMRANNKFTVWSIRIYTAAFNNRLRDAFDSQWLSVVLFWFIPNSPYSLLRLSLFLMHVSGFHLLFLLVLRAFACLFLSFIFVR